MILGNILGYNQVKSEVEKISTEITKALDNSSVKSAIQNMTLQMPEGQFDATKIANYVDSLDHLDEKQKESIISTSALSSKQKEQVQAVRAVKTTTEGNAVATNMDTASKNANTVATKAMTVAQNGLNAALSIGKALLKTFLITAVLTAVGKAISWVSKKIDDAIPTQEEYLEKQQEIIDKSDEIISATESEINALESLQKKIKETNGVQSEMLKLADEVKDVFGKGAENILTQADAYEVLNAKIEANLEMQKESQERAKKEKQEALINESKNQTLNELMGTEKSFKGHNAGDDIRTGLDDFWFGKKKDGTVQDFIKDYDEIEEFIKKRFGKGVASGFGENLKSEAERAREYFEDYISSSQVDSALIEEIIDSLVVSGYTIGYDLEMFEKTFEKLENNSKELDSLWAEYNTALKENRDTSEIKKQFDKIFTEIVSDGDDINYAMASIFEGYFTKVATAFAGQIQEEQNKQYISFEEAWNKDSFKETQEELLDLARSGELTEETLETTEEYESLLDQTGLTAKEAKGRILDLLSATEKLAMASQGTESLTGAYEEYISKGFVTASTLEGLPDSFKKLEGYNLFESIVGDPTSGEAKIQEAFNKIVTEWYKDNEVMKGITEETKEAYVANMKEMNIGNADEVADAYLEASELLDNADEEYVEYVKANNELYADYITSKGEIDQEYFDQIGEANGKLFVLLGEAYKDDLANWCTLVEKKAQAQKVLEKAIGGKFDDSTNLEAEAAKNGYSVAELQAKKSEYYAAQREADEAYKVIQDDLALIKTNFEINFDGIGEGSSTVEDFNWIETLISRIERNITNLGKTISATYKTWSERNNAIKSEYTELNKELQAQINAEKYYRDQAAKVGLSESYKSKVRNGEIRIESITNEDLKEAIQKYQELYEAMLDAQDAQEDIRASLVENFETAFDLIQSKYDSKISELENRGSIIDALIGQQEAKGHIVSKKYYEELINLENGNINYLVQKYNELNAALNSSDITQGTEKWYELKGEIYSVEEALISARTELVEYNKEMRNLDWSLFDKQQEAIGRVREEAEFFIDLMDEEELFDKETMSLSDYGTATMGLHAVNYNTYLKQAQDYGKELAEVNKELAKDPYDEETIERREELLELQRDMITAAQDEIQAIKDLKSEYYDGLIEALEELIDKRKEALQAEKDMYDYERNISEKTKNISSLQKQIAAYEGDNSEETQAKIQQLKLQLEEANADLEQTEYEKWLDDQNQMMDKLLEDAQSWIDERLSNLEEVITDAINITNEHGEEIKATLGTLATDFGYTMSEEMSKIFGEGSVVSTFKQTFTDSQARIIEILNGISSKIAEFKTKSDSEAKSNGVTGGTSTTTPTTATTTTTTTTTATKPASSTSSSSSNNTKKAWGSWFVSKKDSTPDSKLNKETSIVDRLKWKDINSEFSYRAKYYKAMGGSGSYTGTASQNTWMLKQMKANGFAKGGTVGELIDKTGESGFILARTGEEILSLEKIKALGDAFANMYPLVNILDSLTPKIPTVTNNGNSETVNNDVTLNVTLPNVTNYAEFKNALINDKTFTQAMQSMTIGSIKPGVNNSLSKFRY